jgi:hypothetical protein
MNQALTFPADDSPTGKPRSFSQFRFLWREDLELRYLIVRSFLRSVMSVVLVILVGYSLLTQNEIPEYLQASLADK